jgi:hypothetical protein
MLLQVCRDYHSLPDPRTLKLHEIRFFYGALRGELRKHTKPQTNAKPPPVRRRASRRRK